MFYNESDVIDFINENDIKFIRLAFCDPYGVQKNLSIMPTELSRAFESGISIDASEISGFKKVLIHGEPYLLLFPDAMSFSVLPWRPSHGRVGRFFCNIKHSDGSPFVMDGRQLLKQTITMAKNAGYTMNMGAECEFYLFMTDDLGNPTENPYDNAGYMDIAPEDKGENVRREICLTLEEMGIMPESSHHAAGPGQNEVDFKYGDPLTSADNITTYKWVVRNISAKNGLYASFAPNPLNNYAGNNHRIITTPYKNGIYKADPDINERFISGILTHIGEITAFLNTSEQSYSRLAFIKKSGAGHILRMSAENSENKNIVICTPDPVMNPYLAYTLLITAGIEGIQNDIKFDINKKNSITALPYTYSDAIKIACDSKFINNTLPADIIETYKNRYITANI